MRHRRFVMVVIIALIGISISIWDWPKHIRDVFIPKRWGIVQQDQIYRSGQLSRWLVKKTLRSHQINVIIDLQSVDPTSPDQVAEQAVVKQLGIERHRFPLGGDGTGKIANYAMAIKTIVTAVQQDKRVLVHCAAGSQRTGGVIASYRMLVENVPAAAAQAEMEKYNWDPVEDTELSDFLNSHMQQLAELLVEMDVIDQVPSEIPQLNTAHSKTTSQFVPRLSRGGSGNSKQ